MPGSSKDSYNPSNQCNIVSLFTAWYREWLTPAPAKGNSHYWNSKYELTVIRINIVGSLQNSLPVALYQPMINALDEVIAKYATGYVLYTKVYTEDPNNVLSPEGRSAAKAWFDKYITPLNLCKRYPPIKSTKR
jgi:hypothetical protein